MRAPLYPLLLLLALGCRSEVEDLDGDGFTVEDGDCDDGNRTVKPEADELCNGVDDDCDGEIDVGAVDAGTFYADTDGDGYGDPETATTACEPPEGHVDDDADCDDTSDAFHPGASETDCTDPSDYNCDGSVGYEDADGDGFAACDECDDAAADVFPDAAETCNEVDDDCDGQVDEEGATGGETFYQDYDGDGYGDPERTTEACAQPEGFVANADDCDDTSRKASPDGTEICDALDNDCDGEVDVDAVDAPEWYADTDGDEYGDPDSAVSSCEQPDGHVRNSRDCDDAAATASPVGTEVCGDGLDNDCNGQTDEDAAADAPSWYLDADEDGYGKAGSSLRACEQPDGYADNDDDCDDLAGGVYPSAAELCNDVDDDCDGSVDEQASDAPEWYYDGDRDGYGDDEVTLLHCDGVTGYIADGGDCDDDDATAYPGAEPLCDGIDNDCDGEVASPEAAFGDSVDCGASSCQELLDAYPDAEDGEYLLVGKGGEAVDAWCEMDFEGGGWLSVFNFVHPGDGNAHAAQLHSALIVNEAMTSPAAPDTTSEAIYTSNIQLADYTEVVYGWAAADEDVSAWATYEDAAGLEGECYLDGYCGTNVGVAVMDIYPTGNRRTIYTGNSPGYPHVGLGFSGQIILWGFDNNASSNGHWGNWYDNNSCCNAGNTTDIREPGWRYSIYIR